MKKATPFFLAVFFFFFFYTQVSAETYYQLNTDLEYNHSFSGTNNANYPLIGLEGELVSFSTFFSRTGFGLVDAPFFWYECGTTPPGDNAPYGSSGALFSANNCTQIATHNHFGGDSFEDIGDIGNDPVQFTGVASSTQSQSQIQFDPDKWYILSIGDGSTSGSMKIYGGAISNINADLLIDCYGGSGCDEYSMTPAFIVNTQPSTATSTYIYNITPDSIYHSPSTAVDFSFDYFYNANDTVGLLEEACIAIDDMTDFQTLVPTCEPIVSEGTGRIERTITLEAGHTYTWSPVLVGDNPNDTVRGNPRSVFVAGQIDSAFQSPFLVPTTSAGATSSLNNTLHTLMNSYQIIFTKFPLNWVRGITNTIISTSNDTNISSSTQYQFDEVSLDVSELGLSIFDREGIEASSTENMDIVLFSTSTIAQVGAIGAIQIGRTVGGWILWLALFFMIFDDAMAMFSGMRQREA